MAEEVHAETRIKSYGYSARRGNEPGIHTTNDVCRVKEARLKSYLLYVSICMLFLQRQNTGEKSDSWVPGAEGEGRV